MLQVILYIKKYLYEIYQLCSDKVSTKVTVPILWDKNTQQIVNNESSEILRILIHHLIISPKMISTFTLLIYKMR